MFIGSGVIVSMLALFTDHKMELFAIFAILIVAGILNYATKETYSKK